EDTLDETGGREAAAGGTTRSRISSRSGAGRAAVAVGGRRVTRGAELERTGRRRVVTIRGTAARPAGRQRRQRVQERTTDLTLRVVLLHEQRARERLVGLRRRGRRAVGRGDTRVRQGAAVRRVDADGRGDGPGVGLGLGDARPRLHVGVERHGDRGQDADDRHDDEELDQRETTLTAAAREELHHERVPLSDVMYCYASGGWRNAGGVPYPGEPPGDRFPGKLRFPGR